MGSPGKSVVGRGAFLCNAVFLGFFASAAHAKSAESAEQKVSVVNTPQTECENLHYVGNRKPLTPSPLIKLPVGQVKP